jgi:hypothetical protein
VECGAEKEPKVKSTTAVSATILRKSSKTSLRHNLLQKNRIETITDEERRGPIAPTMPGPSMPWPIPEQGAEIEVKKYQRQPTENKNAQERRFFVRVRVVSGKLTYIEYIELRSYRRERDVVTKRESYDSLLACIDADVEIVGKKGRRGWRGGQWFVTAQEMKGLKVPANLDKVFSEIVGRVREFAEREEKRYLVARAASEERMEAGCF